MLIIQFVVLEHTCYSRATSSIFELSEVQAVYISGNIRRPFAYYTQNPTAHTQMQWAEQWDYPRADYLSSSRKRLAPQLIYKGGILHSWKRKMAVAIDRGFFDDGTAYWKRPCLGTIRAN